MHEPIAVCLFIFSGAIPAFCFPFLYAWKARWWTNPGGRLIMSLSVTIFIFYALLVAYALWGRDIFITSQWYRVFRGCAIAFTTVVLWYQFITFIRVAFVEPRRDRKQNQDGR